MNKLILLFGYLTLSACATNLQNSEYFITPEMVQKNETERLEKIKFYKELVDKCEMLSWQKSSAYKKQECLNIAEKSNPTPKFGPELLEILNTANLSAALDYSEGKISKERFFHTLKENEIKVAEYARQIHAAELQKIKQDEQIEELKRLRRAQAWQAIGQSMQNYSNQLQQQQYQQQMLYNYNRPINTNCTRFGNRLNCTTW